eukprot:765566-Hanusia_phi.AAC.8
MRGVFPDQMRRAGAARLVTPQLVRPTPSGLARLGQLVQLVHATLSRQTNRRGGGNLDAVLDTHVETGHDPVRRRRCLCAGRICCCSHQRQLPPALPCSLTFVLMN